MTRWRPVVILGPTGVTPGCGIHHGIIGAATYDGKLPLSRRTRRGRR